MKLLPSILALAVLAITSAAEDKPLFNGKDLTGWEEIRSFGQCRMERLRGKRVKTQTRSSSTTPSSCGRWQCRRFRTYFEVPNREGEQRDPIPFKASSTGEFGPIVGGYQADFEAGKTYSGILYEERGRGILAQRGQQTKIVARQRRRTTRRQGFQRGSDRSVGDSNEIQSSIRMRIGTSTR
jgi:hypothetical protein